MFHILEIIFFKDNDRHWETAGVLDMQNAIQQTSGVVLKRMAKKKGKGKKSGLTNICDTSNSVRQRLENKIFKR